MDVQLRSTGAAGTCGGCLSFGVLTAVMRSHEKQFPLSLGDDALLLRNGARIPWNTITRFRSTDVLLGGKYQHTLYELWHPGGRIHFPSHRIENAEAVISFIRSHLPPNAQLV